MIKEIKSSSNMNSKPKKITIIQSFTTNINVNTATYKFFYKKKDKLGLEKPTSLSVLE